MRYLYILVGVAFLLSLLTGVRQIEPGERAVVQRFGQVLDYKPGPGLHVGLPWGIDTVTRVQVSRVRSVLVGYIPEQDDETDASILPGQMVTGDHNQVNVQAVTDYVVRNDEVERFVFQQEQAEELVVRTAEAVLSQWVASHDVDTVILDGKAATLPSGEKSLLETLKEKTQQRLEPYELGVQIKDARITHLSPPKAVKREFDEVYQAETQIKTREYEAKEYATRTISEAKAREHDLKMAADSYYYKKLSEADTQAKSFEKWVSLAKKMKANDPYFLNAVWWDQVPELYKILKSNGQIDLLDHRLGPNGLDMTIVPSLVPKK